MLTTISDYTGYFSLPKNIYTNDELQAYIDRFEEKALRMLLQCEYDNFEADLLNGLPQTQKWIDVYYPFYKCDDCGYEYESLGLIDLIKSFVFYNYSIESNTTNTILGTVKQRGLASDVVGSQFTRNYIVYNQFVHSFNGIMYEMVESTEEYDLSYKYLEIITNFS